MLLKKIGGIAQLFSNIMFDKDNVSHYISMIRTMGLEGNSLLLIEKSIMFVECSVPMQS